MVSAVCSYTEVDHLNGIGLKIKQHDVIFIDGQGLVLANPLVDPLIQQGLLCEPFEVRLQGYGYYLVHSDRVSENRQYTVFRDWIIEEASVMQ